MQILYCIVLYCTRRNCLRWCQTSKYKLKINSAIQVYCTKSVGNLLYVPDTGRRYTGPCLVASCDKPVRVDRAHSKRSPLRRRVASGGVMKSRNTWPHGDCHTEDSSRRRPELPSDSLPATADNSQANSLSHRPPNITHAHTDTGVRDHLQTFGSRTPGKTCEKSELRNS